MHGSFQITLVITTEFIVIEELGEEKRGEGNRVKEMEGKVEQKREVKRKKK